MPGHSRAVSRKPLPSPKPVRHIQPPEPETLSWDFASSGRRPAVSRRKCTSPPRPSTNLKPSFLSKYVSHVLPTSPELKNYLVSALWKWLCSNDRLCWACGQFSSHFWLQCLLFSNKEGWTISVFLTLLKPMAPLDETSLPHLMCNN